MKKPFELYWGIDVSKEWLDIAVGHQVIRITQDEATIKAFIKTHYIAEKSLLVVLENTGGYERLAVSCLADEGITVHVAHPNKVKAFARARGRLAKSDKIDAGVLKEYGAFIQLSEVRPLHTGLEEKLASYSTRLEQLKEMHHQESCRLGVAKDTGVKQSIQGLLAWIKREIETLKQTIMDLIKANCALYEKYVLLCSMKGVGALLAMKLITDLPELGAATKKEIAALVGVAPITNNSGKRTGKAMIKYGRAGVRRTLYMGALSAIRYNPKLELFYKKLRAAGKVAKVALVAVMRKMLVILNAMIQSKTVFQSLT